ncbi:MAG: hypothetical protein WEB88_15190 [Gemmatimonadota bacterium]
MFTPELEFIRVFAGTFSGRDPLAMHVTDTGVILSTGRVVAGEGGRGAQLMDLEGRPLAHFGDVPATSVRPSSTIRASAYAGAGTFWVAPPDGEPSGVILERWSLDGHRIQVLRRQAPWFPDDLYRDAAGSPGIGSYALHEDSTGLLWMAVTVPASGWNPPRRARERGPGREGPAPDAIDVRLEVIDPVSGSLLAADRFPLVSDGGPHPPFVNLFLNLFKNGRRSYHAVSDSLGRLTIELFDLHLIQRR